MKRPLWLVGITFLLSIRVAFWFFSTTALVFSITTFALALCAYFIGNFKLSRLVVVLFSCALGFAMSAYHSSAKIEPFAQYKGVLVKVEGIVTHVSRNSLHSVRYNVDATFPELDLPPASIVVRDYMEAELSVGDSISTVVELADPKYETTAKYYDQAGIVGEGALLEHPEIIPTSRANLVKHQIINYQQKIASKTKTIFSKNTATLVNSMVFGISDNLDGEAYSDLNRTGISHIISISGMHLSLFSGFLLYVFGFIGLGRRFKYLLTIALTIVFSVFVGLSPAIIRSLVMTIIFLLGKVVNQRGDSLNSMGLAALITGFIWPVWVKSLGLWLSYLATAGIVVVGVPLTSKLYKKLKGGNYYYNQLVRAISGSISISLGAYIFTLPLLIFTFGWVSVVSPFANLLAAPFAAGLILFGALCTLLPQGFPFYPVLVFLTELCSKMILQISSFLSRLSFSVFAFNHPLIVLALIISVFIIVFFLYKKRLGKNLLAATLAVCFVFSSCILFSGMDFARSTQLTSLKDNQLVLSKGGDAVVFVNNNQYSAKYMLEFLDYQNIDTITALICLDYDGKATTIFDDFNKNYSLSSVIGSSDEFSLEVLAGLLPGVQVYSSEGSSLSFFGNCTADFSDIQNIKINIATQEVLLSSSNYNTNSHCNNGTVYLLDDRQIIPQHLVYKHDYLGKNIYDSKTIKI